MNGSVLLAAPMILPSFLVSSLVSKRRGKAAQYLGIYCNGCGSGSGLVIFAAERCKPSCSGGVSDRIGTCLQNGPIGQIPLPAFICTIWADCGSGFSMVYMKACWSISPRGGAVGLHVFITFFLAALMTSLLPPKI